MATFRVHGYVKNEKVGFVLIDTQIQAPNSLVARQVAESMFTNWTQRPVITEINDPPRSRF